MRLRRGTEADAPAILKIHRSAIFGLGLKTGRGSYSREACESWATGLSAELYTDAMTKGGETYIVAEEPGRILGFISFRGNEIIGLYVSPEHSRRGVGKALLSTAEDQIGASGATSVSLGAALSARLFYLARGFSETGRKPWRTRGGVEIEICEMTKQLPRAGG